MTGRNQGAGRGSGGRNGGRRNGNGGRGNGANTRNSTKPVVKEKKFHPLTRGKTPDYSFEEVKKSLIIKMSTMKMEHINDIIESVTELKLMDIEAVKPELVLITDVTDLDREVKTNTPYFVAV